MGQTVMSQVNAVEASEIETSGVPAVKRPPDLERLMPLPRPSFYDQRAAQRPRELRRYYHQLLKTYYRVLVPPGVRVLELGCGLGDLLAAVEPQLGVGVDASPVMIKLARQRHPELTFQVAEAESFTSEDDSVRSKWELIPSAVNDRNNHTTQNTSPIRRGHLPRAEPWGPAGGYLPG